MTRTTAHLISHTHWDREWYMPYERHHVLLAKLMNELLETLEKDERYRYFHLDGQTIIIEDYLQVHPEQRELLERFIRDGRIVIGPWYVLQDEFLTSSEANVRNLLIGHQDAAKYGVISKLGYFPDSFGNMGQAPQLLRQADIETAVFGRGVKPTGFDNMVGELNSSSYESPYSEMYWESPDGSSVLGLLFANWYSNGNEVPVDAEEAKVFWDKKLTDAGNYASTPELLFMNGCDHQPVQRDLADALETARKLYPDTDFIHSSFGEYLGALASSLPDDLVTVTGELRSQHTDGWGTLVNTASARVYLKQLNQRGQTLLEKGAEPLAALAYLASGQAYPHALLTYAWKTLMQNHPHDSICGCSVDEVHREMITRFEKSRHVGEAIVEDSLKAISRQIGTKDVAAWGESGIPVTVFNTTGWERTGTVSVEVAVAKKYFKEGPNPAAIAEALDQQPLELERGRLLDRDGRVLACKAEDLGTRFGYELPDDQFRKPYMARMVRLTFEAGQVPPLGYSTYAWVESPGESAGAAGSAPLKLLEQGMENNFLAVQIREDGAYDVTDKRTGRVFTGLGVYENCGDIGNEYVFRQPEGDVALTTRGLDARISLAEHEPYRITYEIVHEWSIPASADASFEDEKRRMVPFRQRKAGRSAEQVPLRIVTRISLEANGTGVQVSAAFNNQAKDHRLRVLFPTGLAASTLRADSIFEAAERDIEPAPDWINPSNAQHQQAYVSVSDGSAGLLVANKGLNEYEVLRDGSNTIAVTLLRSVSELGDWGVFPTPEAQCLGGQTVEFAVRPFAGDADWTEACAWAYQYQVPWFTVQTGWQQGRLPVQYQPLEWEGPTMALSAFKLSEEHEDIILRWYNLAHQEQDFALVPHFPVEAVHASDILERRKQTAILDEGILRSTAGKAQIVTYALQTVQP
ncbi:alpha-mannosidase [Paenibacillus sp. FSL R10-2736]|uniref:alpha-mannosidase n=1 Tax=Paenibacillus sp. FSL R10-2736 TaxID=2954692 RepID=UPI0030F72B70